MAEGTIDWTFNSLSFLVKVNPYFQLTIGIASLIISGILFYVVIKSTPEELMVRRANVITQLVGCVLQSVIYSILLQKKYDALIFTGFLRNIGSLTCAIAFVVWVANTTFTANSAITSSISHYLGLMEGVRQSKGFLGWYSKQSFQTKSIIITCSHTFVSIWSGLSLFASIDFEEIYHDRTLTFLKNDYSLVHMKANTTITILGTSFAIFIIFYFFQCFYLNRKVWLQLAELKPSISPRTWEILHHTSLLFLGIAIQPIVSFFIPTVIFIILNFGVKTLQSSALLNCIVCTNIVLYSSAPYLFHVLTLISFKVYRLHFYSILRTSFTRIRSIRSRRMTVSPHIDSFYVNKDAS